MDDDGVTAFDDFEDLAGVLDGWDGHLESFPVLGLSGLFLGRMKERKIDERAQEGGFVIYRHNKVVQLRAQLRLSATPLDVGMD